MKRNATAVWSGNLKNGKGSLSSDSGFLKETPYSFSTRFEGAPGTNPEELIAAAHAGCFTMALSAALQGAGFTADRLQTTATLSLENVPATSWTITSVHLTTVAKIPGITPEKFAEIAAGAKANCPVSRVLKAEITLDAKLELPDGTGEAAAPQLWRIGMMTQMKLSSVLKTPGLTSSFSSRNTSSFASARRGSITNAGLKATCRSGPL